MASILSQFPKVLAGMAGALLVAGTAAAADYAMPDVPGGDQPPVVYTGEGLKSRSAAADELLRRARHGDVAVIVGLRMRLTPEDGLSPAGKAAQLRALRAAQNGVLRRVRGGADDEGVRRYDFIPYVAFSASAAELRRLLADPDVVSVQQDTLYAPQLSDSIPLIHADDAYQKYGISGQNRVVAVLDSGVAKKHPMLDGKVVSEACYSTKDAPRLTPVCPGGKTQSVAKGSGVNCSVDIDGCNHGTHVASIAVGDATYRGVAFGADLIAIQIFSRNNSADQCAALGRKKPCAFATGADLLKGLERVYKLRGFYKIAAVNLSIGGGHYSQNCDGADPAGAAALSKLRAAGIAPVVSAGNDGSDTKVSNPGCLSAAITVGNSTKADFDEQLEHVAGSSNYGKLIELMAPGEKILAAVPPGSKCITKFGAYCKLSGTSMAAPHVAGAFAMLRQLKQSASVDDILEALECSGKTVERPEGGGVDKPRIDLLGAANWLAKAPNVKRSWDFDEVEQALDWTPFAGEWKVKGGEYAPKPIQRGVVFSSTASCNRKLEVTAKVRRVYEKGKKGDPHYAPTAGVMLKSKLDYKTRTISGYYFSYLYLPRFPDQHARGWAAIQRIDAGSPTTLCDDNEDVEVNFLEENTVRAVSEGSKHTFYLNGKLICSATDATYESGPVAVLTGYSDAYPTTGGKFFVKSLSIKSMDDGGSAPSPPPLVAAVSRDAHPAAAPASLFVAGVN